MPYNSKYKELNSYARDSGPPFRRSARVNLTLTLTPRMADLRNGGPPESGAGTMLGAQGHNCKSSQQHKIKLTINKQHIKFTGMHMGPHVSK